MKAVSVFSINPYLAIFSGEDGPRYTFDGTTMYATMPPWAANGKPRRYSVRFNANAVSTGTEQYIMSGTEGGVELAFYLHATLPVITIRYRSDTGTQAIESILDPADEIVAGENYTLEVINLGTGSQILLNGKDVNITAFEASDGIQPALTHIGAKHDATSFFAGTIWSSILYDESPITNTWANMGNGVLYGELEQAIVLEGDFEISFDCIRQDGAIFWRAFAASADAAQGQVSIFNDGRLVLWTGGTANTFSGALNNVVIGQHFKCKFVASGGQLECFVDGVSAGAPQGQSGSFTMGRIGDIANATTVPTGAALQNIVIKDLDNNLTWNYPLDEGPTTDTGPELIEGDPTLTGSLSTWDGSIMHLEGLNPTGTFEGTEVVADTDYHVTFDYNTSAANTFIRLGGGGNVGVIPGPTVGTFDNVLTAGGTGYILQVLSDGTGDFSNFSIKAATGGSIIHNTDPSTPGYNGVWTDTDWTFIEANLRRYPMNDGPDGGGQFKCIDGTGEEQPTLAADIIGYDEGAWD